MYPNNQQAGYLWYHDHSPGVTRLNVYMGLAGLYFLRDSVESALNLPTGEFEIPLVIQDRRFNADGSFRYPATREDSRLRRQGDGQRQGLAIPRRQEGQVPIPDRERLGLPRWHTLALSPPSGTFVVHGDRTELGLSKPQSTASASSTIGPGERHDVVVNFAGLNTGDEVFLENAAGAPFPNGTVDLTEVMQVPSDERDRRHRRASSTLRSITHISPASAVRTRDFRLKKSGLDGCGRQSWKINELGWTDIAEYPELGTTEIWRFINDSGTAHPMHMHLVAFQVLDRDGFTHGCWRHDHPEREPAGPSSRGERVEGHRARRAQPDPEGDRPIRRLQGQVRLPLSHPRCTRTTR